MSEHLPVDASLDRPRSRFAFLLRPWFLVTATVLAVLVAIPLAYRSTRFTGIPPIEDIVDLESIGHVDITDDENAFTYYHRAWKSLPKYDDQAVADAQDVIADGWNTVPQTAKDAVRLCEPALIEWKRGTDCRSGVRIQPADIRLDDISAHSEAREFIRLVPLHGAKLIHERKVDEAWSWLRAMCRYSRHLGNPGTMIDRLTGMTAFAMASPQLAEWAVHPDVTENHLRQALSYLKEFDQQTALPSVTIQIEYLSLRQCLTESDDLGMLSEVFPEIDDYPDWLEQSYLFVRGEPDLCLLLLRHLTANHLSQCDLPRPERRVAGTARELFDPPVAKSPQTLLASKKLDELSRRSEFVELLDMASLSLVDACDRELARRQALELCLWVEIFRRRHGTYPDSLDALVPEFVAEIPRDVFGLTAADRMLMFRREPAAAVKPGDEFEEESLDTAPGLIIYSRGDNGIDDGGRIDFSDDIGLRIPIPVQVE